VDFQVDMELLRRIGLARQTVESVLDGSASLDELKETLAVIRGRMSEDLGFLQTLFQGLEDGTESTDQELLSRTTLEALEATENFLFSESPAEARSALEEAAGPLLRRLDDPGPGDDTPDLNQVALLLARIPDAPEELPALREALASLADDHPELEEAGALLIDPDDEGAVAEALTLAGTAVEALMLGTEEPAPPPPPAREEEPGAAVAEGLLDDPPETTADAEAETSPEKSMESGADDLHERAPGDDPAAPAAPGTTAASPPPSLAPLADDAPPPDADLLKDFLEEGTEHLDSAEVALLALEQNPEDLESVNVVFRAFHTIKGVAGFMNLLGISEAAHRAESLLSRVRDGEIRFTAGIADLTLRASDLLRALLDGVRPLLRGEEPRVPPGADRILAALADEELVQRLASGEEEQAGLTATPPREDGAGDGAGAPGDGGVPAGQGTAGGASGEETVRVRTDRLDRLVDLVGELVVAHSMVSQDEQVRGVQTDLTRKVDHSSKILRELQDLSTSLRMVPLQGAFNRMARVVRDLSRKSGKPVRLTTSGEGTELDRGMVDVITDPLVHMVRNAVDHAVEPPEARAASGKPREAEIHLAAYQAQGGVVIEIRDDGKGLDRERILSRAVERGVVEADASLSDKEVWSLIFAPGFSTAETVTEVSGRGVGMDVVRRGVESLRGVVDVDSVPGEGTTFYIRLPLTLAITEGMLLSVGQERYIVPMTKIRESFRPRHEDLSTITGQGECVSHHGDLLPLHRLARLYGVEGAQEEPTRGLVVVVGDGHRRGALLVDEILDQQSFVVKPVSGLPARVAGIAGGAVLGDGSVGLIVDPDELVEAVRSRGAAALA
jgi:two-component system chemotaxis sensor kinase CheA